MNLRILVATCVAAALAACTMLIEYDGQTKKFKLLTMLGGLPEGAQPMGGRAKVTDPITGHEVEVELYDSDGDGKADVGKADDGRVYKGEIQPPAPGGMFAPEDLPNFIVWGQAPATLKPFIFDQTADTYLATHNISTVVFGNAINTGTDTIDVLEMRSDSAQISGYWLDLRLHWNAEAGFIDPTRFPSLQYEYYGLPDAPGAWPHYMVMRVAGDAGVVLNWLGQHGIYEVRAAGIQATDTATGAVHSISNPVVRINTQAMQAHLTGSGLPRTRVLLRW